MIVGVVRKSFIDKNDGRLDPEFYLGGQTAARSFDRVADRHEQQAAEARANAGIIRKHIDDLAATGEVKIISSDERGDTHDVRAARFLARTLKK